jgi:phosphate transport system permease protein
MTIALDRPDAAGSLPVPRQIDPGLPRGDKVFHAAAKTVGVFVLVLTGSIGLFLGLQSIPTFRHYGTSFLTRSEWLPATDQIGISAVVLGTIEVALVAMVVSFPLALFTGIFISEYAPAKLKSALVSMIDLMAAVPPIIYGLWAVFLFQPHIIYVARWLHTYLGWIPFFHVGTDPHAATWEQSRYTSSVFVAGLAVSLMTVPLACAVMRGVFAQAPIGEREAALALGATKWGMIRTVVIPFGRGGIIGGTMLSLGRALGETAAVLLIISPAFDLKFRILEAGTETISALIAGNFGDASTSQLSALLSAGFVLFTMTLCVNTIAAIFINRSRSGAATDI